MDYPIWYKLGGMALLYFACGLLFYMGTIVFRGYLETGSRLYEKICGSALMFMGTFFSAVLTYEAFFRETPT